MGEEPRHLGGIKRSGTYKVRYYRIGRLLKVNKIDLCRECSVRLKGLRSHRQCCKQWMIEIISSPDD